MPGAKPPGLPQYVGQGDARGERGLRRALDHRTVRERVAERHAELEHVGTLFAERRREAVRFVDVWKSGGQVGNEGAARGLPGGLERAADPASHAQPLNAAARR